MTHITPGNLFINHSATVLVIATSHSVLCLIEVNNIGSGFSLTHWAIDTFSNFVKITTDMVKVT